MIITRLGLIKVSELEKGVLVHSIAIGTGDDRRFIMGMCFEDGIPLGVVVRHAGTDVRRWQRIDHVLSTAEKLLGQHMTSFTVGLPEAANDQVFQFFMNTYRLAERSTGPSDPIEQDRLAILKAVEDARATSTTDAG